MQEYVRYELEYRKYSSNVVLGVYEFIDENGKKKEKRDVVICPILKKEDGDIHASFILEHMSKSLVKSAVVRNNIKIHRDVAFKLRRKNNKQ